MKKKKLWFMILGIAAAAAAAVILAAWLVLDRRISVNSRAAADYPVRGVDVSSYQGKIDWQRLEEQGIRFAFIKATEGSSFADPLFDSNYTNALETSLRIGAYHFFSYDSKGLTQAENFIATVPLTENMLPPVIDVEFYGDKEKHLPDKSDVVRELQDMIDALSVHYGMMPVIYATYKAYYLYIAGEFDTCDIWIRNVYFPPVLPDGRQWVFWQYNDRERLDGYEGTEDYIDMNVFNGTEADFEKYPQKWE